MMTMSIRQRPVRAAALADVSVFDTDFFDDSFDDDADQHSGHSMHPHALASQAKPKLGLCKQVLSEDSTQLLG